ncbi:MAG: hypothetical protein IJ684_00840 [Bacteroidales bacterium]|nr:hypothetical protein [Bacteroidales bacterium]
MSKLYVFGIGGTGARVLRSLTMLLASGVKCDMDIVPIIIDPDSSADSLTKAVAAFDAYTKVRGALSYKSGDDKFFATAIEESVPRYYLPLQNTANMTFEKYISLSTMVSNNQALMRMLFSESNLASDMAVGFKGNPNMGSVVLNQFVSSNEFQQFANSFQQGDRIFIISSIFGGTGASGFPLLLKTLRSNSTVPNFNLLNNAVIGGVTVLPYFSVQVDNNSSIDSSDFIDKTKAALAYYDTNITGTGSIDRLYYIADTITPTYENHEGGAAQNNSAHLVELFSALAVVDFAAAQLQHTNNTQCMEYGITKDANPVTFSELGNASKAQIFAPLTQFLLFSRYLDKARKWQYRFQPWAIDAEFDSSFFGSGFENDVEKVLHLYEDWLRELEGNTRSFSPFDLSKRNHIFNMVKGVSSKRTKFNNYALFDDVLNTQHRPNGVSKEEWFVDLFYQATKQLVERKF